MRYTFVTPNQQVFIYSALTGFVRFAQPSPSHVVAAGSGEQEAESGAELGLAARCLTCIADVLVGMAGGRGGLRSGPAANKAWSSAYLLLEKDLRGGVQALAAERERWLGR